MVVDESFETMSDDRERRLRNLGIVAHINAGKTTLTERILFDTGKQRFMGDVESGTATMDWMAEEQDRGISIQAAVTSVGWRGHLLNLIDTPGHVDFTVEVERCLQVLDGVAVVVDSIRAVESQTETVWRHVEARGIPRLVFVNKMDRAGADFDRCLAAVGERLRCRPLPITRPIVAGGQLVGLLDVIGATTELWGDAADAEIDSVAARSELVEVCADYDDGIMAAFLEGEAVTAAQLHAVVRAETQRGTIVPVLAGSALENRGVAALLDAVCRYLPSPVDRLATPELRSDVWASVSDHSDQPFAGLVFKVQADGDERLAFLRVFRGRLAVGDLVETGEGEPVRVTGLWLMHAVRRDDVAEVGPGQIAALPVTAVVQTGETLRAQGSTLALPRRQFSAPVLTVTLEPRAAAGGAEVARCAEALVTEDPTLRLRRDPVTDVLLVSGMGELHLEVFASRLNRELPEQARFGKPQVQRREGVAGSAAGRAVCTRVVGDREISAWASVAVRPSPDRSRNEVVWRVDQAAESLERELIPALQALAETGISGLAPAAGICIAITEVGRSHEDGMSTTLLCEAGELACRRAVESAGRIDLEPWMRFSVDCPPDTLSHVLADLRSRAAEISAILPAVDTATVRGRVSLAAVIGYATPLRSMTRGKGWAELVFDRLEPVSGAAGDRTVC